MNQSSYDHQEERLKATKDDMVRSVNTTMDCDEDGCERQVNFRNVLGNAAQNVLNYYPYDRKQ